MHGSVFRKSGFYLPFAHHCLQYLQPVHWEIYCIVFSVGYVIDFIYFSLIDFPVFNLADVYVVVSGIFSDPVCVHEIQG